MKPATILPKQDLAILIVGDPGTRKTTLALQFPQPYVFDADCNMAAPLTHLTRSNPDLPNHVFYNHATADDDGKEIPMPMRYEWMCKCFNEAYTNPNIKTIIGDSLTSIIDLIIAHVKRLAGRTEQQEMRIQDWGTFGGVLKNLVTKLRASGKITIFTAHNRVEKDEADGQWKYFINIPGQSSTSLSGLFTDVISPYVAVQGLGANTSYLWRVRTLPASPNDHRGFKSSLELPPVIDYDKLVEKIKSLKL